MWAQQVSRLSSDHYRVAIEPDFLLGMLALIFFTAGLAFWTYSWWVCDRAESLLAFWYATIFEFAGFISLAVWRITSG